MKFRYKASCRKGNLRHIRDFVSTSLSNWRMSEDDVYMLVTAIDEVCANLIIHGHECNNNQIFEVKISKQEEDTIRVDIVDSKCIFDINKYKMPDLNELIKKRSKGGMGLMLVKRLIDKIELESDDYGSRCVLYKKLSLS
ncbi:ATP-binding protein [Marinigracilibium pacificum]|uniref:ATP-binding protein n=1 Tax=Marinigracilibium pacificum TaxID=2729599 RepID=A0A848IR35_9BACT|nr:ATP-binding protein [Marinigracilibium pacificum]NMM46817.1 ATP-binding protein [Marinigracilibium pacificum]